MSQRKSRKPYMTSGPSKLELLLARKMQRDPAGLLAMLGAATTSRRRTGRSS